MLDKPRLAVFVIFALVVVVGIGIYSGAFMKPEPKRHIILNYNLDELNVYVENETSIKDIYFPVRKDVEYKLKVIPPFAWENRTLDICFKYYNLTVSIKELEPVEPVESGWDCWGHIWKTKQGSLIYTLKMYVGGDPENQTLQLKLYNPYNYSEVVT